MFIDTTEIAIWQRIIEPQSGDLPLEVARYFANFGFADEDLAQLHELAVKNQSGNLTEEESSALESYRRVGYQIDLLRSKARLTIRDATS